MRVHLERQRPPPHRRDLAGEAGIGIGVPKPEGDVGAGIGERQRDGAAEAAGGAGDEGGLSAEIEAGQFRHVFLPLSASRLLRPAGREVRRGEYRIV